MQAPDELRVLPTWKAHVLTGGRKGVWSLHVTAIEREHEYGDHQSGSPRRVHQNRGH
jgi:hypothetical protein